MKRFYNVVAVLLAVCFLMTSCMTTAYYPKKVSTENEARDRWKGATKKEIIQNFGPPNSERTDGGDGTLLVYNMNKSDGETINRSCYIWFYLNSNDICTDLKSDYFYKYESVPCRVPNPTGTGLLVCFSSIGLGLLLILLAAL